VDRRRTRLPLLRIDHDRDRQDRPRQRPAIRAPDMPELRRTRTRHDTTQEPHPHQERTMTGTRMDVLGLMAAAEPLWQTACEDYSEGESVAIIRVQLELHRHAVGLILERIETE